MEIGLKNPNQSERSISKVVKKRLVASRKIPKESSILSKEDICIKRNDIALWQVIGTER